jgi:hypothetical protein
MPFAFLIIGLMLIVIGARGNAGAAGSLLQSEFTGQNSFLNFLIAIMVLGMIGYYKPLKPVADGLIGLVILVIVIANQNSGGLFAAFENAVLGATPISPAPSTASGMTVPANPTPAQATGQFNPTAGLPNTGFNFNTPTTGVTPNPNPWLTLSPIGGQ